MNPSLGHGYAVRNRRSVVACMSCRRRKIRCDVAINGSPCTNCRLDGAQCHVVKARSHRKMPDEDRARERQLQVSLHRSVPVAPINVPPALINTTTAPPLPSHYAAPFNARVAPVSVSASPVSNPSNYLIRSPVRAIDYLSGVQGDALDQDVNPSCLSANTTQLCRVDAENLNNRKALSLPKTSTIRTLLQHYFLHVHPCFPIVRESDFSESTRIGKPFSMLVFRAMLFAAACHAPSECAEEAGYTSSSQMWGALYKKTKVSGFLIPSSSAILPTSQMLYDVGVEKNSYHIAQAALLLTWHADFLDPMCNTTWLAIAVQHAQKASAYQYALLAPSKYSPSQLKRLWWCCILRDRTLAIADRRPLVITSDQFDATREGLLIMSDVWDQESDFFDSTEMTLLYQIFTSQCQLASSLTGLGALSDPSPGLVSPTVCIENEKAGLREIFLKLSSWEEHCEVLLSHPVANRSIPVAINIHMASLLYLAARISLWNRLAVLDYYKCCCTIRTNPHQQYVKQLAQLVSSTNEQVEWFAMNRDLYCIPITIRCLTILPHALNLLWLDGDDITQPGHPLKYYTELDQDYSTRCSVFPVNEYVRGVLMLIVGVYDRTMASKQGGSQHNGTFPSARLGLESSTPEAQRRLADICFRTSFLMDYVFMTGDCSKSTDEGIASLCVQFELSRPTFHCSSFAELNIMAASSALHPPSPPSLLGGYGYGSPQSATSPSSSFDFPSDFPSDFSGELQQLEMFGQTLPNLQKLQHSQPPQRQKALPAPPEKSYHPPTPENFYHLPSSIEGIYQANHPSDQDHENWTLGRNDITATANAAPHTQSNRQDWVTELDELLATMPLYGY
ncbi:hypothetical protein BJX99DRAFT_258548 [Aspergillus californicus]